MDNDDNDDNDFAEEANPNRIDPMEISFFQTSHGNRGLIARNKMYNPIKINNKRKQNGLFTCTWGCTDNNCQGRLISERFNLDDEIEYNITISKGNNK